MTSIASSVDLTASPGLRRGPPMPTTASQNAPAPSPTSTRPPEMTSRDAAAFASMAGGLRGRFATSGKKRTRSVTGTRVGMSGDGSRNRRGAGGGGRAREAAAVRDRHEGREERPRIEEPPLVGVVLDADEVEA